MNRSNVLFKVILAAIMCVPCINSASNPEREATLSVQPSESKQKRSLNYFLITYTQQNMLSAIISVQKIGH
ncbi:hypothetical protein [Psychroserpens sp.]|uniref:hypothetical protein n=1 Tax=Psychroserpens sp. TaxID=2020870 RepID=UPI002B270A25|nr:hypothetical protein [Psychroserpens sp.]